MEDLPVKGTKLNEEHKHGVWKMRLFKKRQSLLPTHSEKRRSTCTLLFYFRFPFIQQGFNLWKKSV